MLAGMIGTASPAIGSMASPGARGAAEAGTAVVVKQMISDFESNCALLTSGNVYCWGYGLSGELGDGKSVASATPVAVVRTSGAGALGGVASLASDGQGVCAVVASGGVDCWGYGGEGELGNGTFGGANRPVIVKGTGGKGTLTGVASIAPYHGFGGSAGYCALLKSGRVDCWGFGPYGQLGDGRFYTTGAEGSDVPVAVKGTGGKGTLTGVASLDSTGGNGFTTNCARLTSGGVDCWGYGQDGQLGNGVTYPTSQGSDVPVAVKGTGGKGTLTGVGSLDEGFDAFCAVRTSGAVDCWGLDGGQLGDGGGHPQSNVPVAVEGVGGAGTLSGVASLSSADEESFCAMLTSHQADCWGTIVNPYPTPVTGLSGSGRLTGIASMAATAFDTFNSFCARLATGGVDCWGNGFQGELGNGSTNSTVLTPVKVSGAGGSGHLAGVTAIAGSQGDGNFCAVLGSGKADCWGFGNDGELGNGAGISSDVPVAVRLP
jgi:alpha-tubulin suppressor-like RCC1 family protein